MTAHDCVALCPDAVGRDDHIGFQCAAVLEEDTCLLLHLIPLGVLHYTLSKTHVHAYAFDLCQERRDELGPVLAMELDAPLRTVGMRVRHLGERGGFRVRHSLAFDVVVRNPALVVDAVDLVGEVRPVELEVADNLWANGEEVAYILE
jgi:hypothetical protein